MIDHPIAAKLLDERRSKFHGGLYHKTQIHLAYNSNRIEGSRLTEEQTRCIFETRTIGFNNNDALPVDDIIETANHFTAFDYLLDTLDNPLSEVIIKRFHQILKAGTADALKSWFNVGEWKQLPNEVGGAHTVQPGNVQNEIIQLNDWFNSPCPDPFARIVEYHYRFEKIHPFQDGNGRVGRLIMFRQCLTNGIIPFIIDAAHQPYYYRGLKEFPHTKDYLIDTCRSAQDAYAQWANYFLPAQ